MNIAGGKSAASFMERCIAFIGDNAGDCVKTNAFLNLPKEALIKLISSDFVSIFFISVLAWFYKVFSCPSNIHMATNCWLSVKLNLPFVWSMVWERLVCLGIVIWVWTVYHIIQLLAVSTARRLFPCDIILICNELLLVRFSLCHINDFYLQMQNNIIFVTSSTK